MPNKSINTTSLINEIKLDRLFGQLSYVILPTPNNIELLLLYGDNGAGKSTILRLIYHLLSPEPFGGHRTAVSKIPFKKITITMTSGIVVSAEKKEPFDSDSYTLTMKHPGQRSLIKYIWEKDKSKRDNPSSEYAIYCKLIQEAGVRFHFLSDNRRVEGLEDEPRLALARRRDHLSAMEIHLSRMPDVEGPKDMTEILVIDAIERTIQWFQQQALTGANVGYTSVNAIYTELLRRIIDQSLSVSNDADHSITELQSRLRMLHHRNSHFSKYGLTPVLDPDLLISQLNSAKNEHTEILYTILQPYLDGNNARLDALQPVQKVIDEFVTMLGEFFSRKSISLDVRKELSIVTADDQPLLPRMLSSGEKQLLLLLCNAITARNDGTIFIIDEPEISLNVKWQRRLIKALLTCLEGVQSQLVMATHSIEILSQYKEFVVTLDDISKTE